MGLSALLFMANAEPCSPAQMPGVLQVAQPLGGFPARRAPAEAVGQAVDPGKSFGRRSSRSTGLLRCTEHPCSSLRTKTREGDSGPGQEAGCPGRLLIGIIKPLAHQLVERAPKRRSRIWFALGQHGDRMLEATSLQARSQRQNAHVTLLATRIPCSR